MGIFRLYIDYFKQKCITLLRKQRNAVIDFEDIAEELWVEDFSKPEKCRFQEESGDGYTAEFSLQNTQTGNIPAFKLTVQRKHLYAWAVNNVYRYKDFVLEAVIAFPHTGESASAACTYGTGSEQSVLSDAAPAQEDVSAGCYAAGFLFRYISEYAFYALAISNKGWLRLDAVVNSTPIPILGWTKLPEPAAHAARSESAKHSTANGHSQYNAVPVTLIANGTTITVLVNGIWIASCEDDTIQAAGKIAFAELADKLDIPIPTTVPPEQRLYLAQNWYAMGKYIPALLQLQAAWNIRPPQPEERVLAGRIYAAQHLTEEAEQELQTVLTVCPQHEAAYAELSGLYYQSGAYRKLNELLAAAPEKLVHGSAFLSNLLGHCLHEEHRYEEAAAAYRRAFTLKPKQGLFALNEARELSACGKTEAAAAAYRQAAGSFLQQQAYRDALTAVTALERLAPHDARTQSFAAKLSYALEDYPRARTLLQRLCRNGSTDSADWYLYGLLLRDNPGSAEDMAAHVPDTKNAPALPHTSAAEVNQHTAVPITAAAAFKQACILEPDCALYLFRLAESLFLSGGAYQPVLAKALAADPENGWIHNLAALAALQENRLEEAAAAAAQAQRLLPLELPPLENYLEILRRKKQLSACFPLFDTESEQTSAAVTHNPAGAYHILANALHNDEAFDEAAEWYRRAVKLDPHNAVLLTDKAENDRALYLLNEADDTLVKALDSAPSARIYQLIAAVSIQKGDYLRAELTLRTALEQFPDAAGLYYDLLSLYRLLHRFDTAAPLLARLKKLEHSDRVTALEHELADFM